MCGRLGRWFLFGFLGVIGRFALGAPTLHWIEEHDSISKHLEYQSRPDDDDDDDVVVFRNEGNRFVISAQLGGPAQQLTIKMTLYPRSLRCSMWKLPFIFLGASLFSSTVPKNHIRDYILKRFRQKDVLASRCSGVPKTINVLHDVVYRSRVSFRIYPILPADRYGIKRLHSKSWCRGRRCVNSRK